MACILLELTPALAEQAGVPPKSRLEANRLDECIATLSSCWPVLKGITQADAPIHKRVRIYLNQVDIHQLNMPQTPLVEGDRITVVPLTTEIQPSGID